VPSPDRPPCGPAPRAHSAPSQAVVTLRASPENNKPHAGPARCVVAPAAWAVFTGFRLRVGISDQIFDLKMITSASFPLPWQCPHLAHPAVWMGRRHGILRGRGRTLFAGSVGEADAVQVLFVSRCVGT